MQTQHALLRTDSRIASTNLNVSTLMQKAERVAASNLHGGAIALKLTDIPFCGDNHNEYYSRTQSNGDAVWAIIRDQSVITYFFRRSDQKQTPESMRVDKILVCH